MRGKAVSRRTARSAGVLAYLVVASSAGYCYGCPPSEDAPSAETRLTVLPSEVWAEANETFLIRARLVDERGNVYSDGDAADVRWSSATLTLQAPAKGPTVVVSVPTGATGVLSLTAELAGHEAHTIPVYATTSGVSASEIDVVRSNVDAGEPPAILLLDGRTTARVEDTLIAFVGKGELDHLECGLPAKCGEIILFSRARGLIRQSEIDWTRRCDDVDVSNPSEVSASCLNANAVRAPAPLPLTVPVQYVILAAGASAPGYALSPGATPSTTDVEAIVRADVEFARKVFADSWTGLDLPTPVTFTHPAATTSVTLAVGTADPCMESETPVAAQLIGVTIDPKKITVAYVDRLLRIDGTEIEFIRGVACPWNATYGSIILISWANWGPTVLAHELAHALGPWEHYPWGHTEGIAGFNESNILWDYEAATNRAPRSVITLGQAFRLSLDANGFFHRGSASTLPICQFYPTIDDPDVPCPRLSRDVIPP